MNNKLVYNKIFSIVPAIAAMFLAATMLSMSTFTIVSIFAQSDGTNQAMEDAGQSANQTGEGMQQGASDVASSAGQSANQTGEAIQGNASDVGSKITEGVKNLAKNIGEKLQDLAK